MEIVYQSKESNAHFCTAKLHVVTTLTNKHEFHFLVILQVSGYKKKVGFKVFSVRCGYHYFAAFE